MTTARAKKLMSVKTEAELDLEYYKKKKYTQADLNQAVHTAKIEARAAADVMYKAEMQRLKTERYTHVNALIESAGKIMSKAGYLLKASDGNTNF